MFDIIISNFGFWFNLLIPVAIALFLVITRKEYIWKEFGIQVGATLTYVFVVYLTLFSTTTDLLDKEYWNGSVTKFEYYEEWDEEVTYTESYECGTSKNPRTCTRTKTRIDHHPEYYQLKTTNNETVSISRSEYRTAAREFGHTEHNIARFNQVSFGDGDKYVSIPNITIPTSVSHTYTNYVTAAPKNMIHMKVSEAEIKQLEKNNALSSYPSYYEDKYGAPKITRLINKSGITIKESHYKSLDLMSAKYGRSKQMNPIIFITKEDRNFKDALEHYWNKAKKNDNILILGVDTDGNVLWSDTIAWTNNTDYIVDMSNAFKGKNIETEFDKIIEKFTELSVNGYKRKPMEEFAYLKENITLAWYWQLFIFLGNVVLSFFVFRMFLNNYTPRSYR
jgi:hypothetical protein